MSGIPAATMTNDSPGVAHPYVLLAELLEYPGPELMGLAERCRAMIADRCPAAASAVEAFGQYAASTDLTEVEERFARTFDFHPPHCLDLGYQLFGEGYKRGTFLVKIQAAVNAHGIPHETELADHLTVVLRLLPLLPEEEARSLVDEVVLPVVAKVLGAFTDSTDPYRMLLEALRALLVADFDIRNIRPVPEERAWAAPGQPAGPPLAANRHDDIGGSGS